MDGRVIKAGPVRRDHDAVRVRARRRGRYLVRRGERYALIDPDAMLTLEQVAHEVDNLPARPGQAPTGRLPGEGDRVLSELRALAAQGGYRLHKSGDSYWLLNEDDAMDLGEVAEIVR